MGFTKRYVPAEITLKFISVFQPQTNWESEENCDQTAEKEIQTVIFLVKIFNRFLPFCPLKELENFS